MSEIDELRRIAAADQASAALRDFATNAETILSVLADTVQHMAVVMQGFTQPVVDFREWTHRDPRTRVLLMTLAQAERQYQRQQMRRRRKVRQGR